MHAIHWFNPCAWLVVAKLRKRAEQAADELALRGASTVDAVAYSRLLLDFAEQAPPARTVPALGFVPFLTKRGLRQRIDRLTRPIPQPVRPLRWLLGIAILLIAVSGLTDAQQPPAPEPKISLAEISVVEQPTPDDGPTSLCSYDVAALLDKLRDREPGMDVEQSLIRYAGHAARSPRIADEQLFVEATERQHRALTEELEAMTRSGPQQIATEFRVLQIDLALANAIDWKAAPIMGQQQTSTSGPVLFAQIAEAQLGELIRAVYDSRSSLLLLGPKVTTFNGQTVVVGDFAQRPFVTGVFPADDNAWKPVLKIFDEGFKAKLRSVVTEAGTIELSIDFEHSEIDEVRLANLPIRAVDRLQTGEGLVTVQVPTIRTYLLQMTADLAEGESLVIAVPRTFDRHAGQHAVEASATSFLYTITPRKIAGTIGVAACYCEASVQRLP